MDSDVGLWSMVAALDVYWPDEWHDFFVMVGGGAAVLTGLVFVAMSLNVNVIAEDATHRYRAIGTLTGITATFVICALALMGGQDHRAVGAEWFLVAAVAAVVFVYGYVQAVRLSGTERWLRPGRVVGASVLYLAELTGAAILFAGHKTGLYIASVALIVLLAYMITGAWLLIIGVSTRKTD
jgi:hypothetical protein